MSSQSNHTRRDFLRRFFALRAALALGTAQRGVPVALLCAADEDSKREFSCNLQIPLAH